MTREGIRKADRHYDGSLATQRGSAALARKMIGYGVRRFQIYENQSMHQGRMYHTRGAIFALSGLEE